MEVTALLAGLTTSQRAAVTSPAAPLCIVAGAGSGKTRVLTRRIAHRCSTEELDARHVLALTFTRKAAGELTDRLRALGLRDGITAGTFHAVAYGALRAAWADDRRTPPELLDRKLRLVGSLLERGAATTLSTIAVVQEIEWAKARCLDPGDLGAAAVADERLSARDAAVVDEVYGRYEAEKRRRNLVDFDDLLAQCAQRIEQDPTFGAAQRWRFRHLFVDEFQDVNPLQHRLLSAWLGDSRDLCVVGDPAQAIYGWNGADATYLRSFGDRHPTAAVVVLEDNFRSTPQIVRASRSVLRHDDDVASAPTSRSTRRRGRRPRSCASTPTTPSPTAWRAPCATAIAPADRGPTRRCWPAPTRSSPLSSVRCDGRASRRRCAAGRAWSTVPSARRPGPLRPRAHAGGHGAGRPLGRARRPGRRRGAGRARRARGARPQYPGAHRRPAGAAQRLRRLGAPCRRARRPAIRTPASSWPPSTPPRVSNEETSCVIGVEAGFVPIGQAAKQIDERRLLHVALSRASHELVISWAANRRFGGKVVERRRSPLLRSLDPDGPVADRHARPRTTPPEPEPSPRSPGWPWRASLGTGRRRRALTNPRGAGALACPGARRRAAGDGAERRGAADAIAQRRPRTAEDVATVPGVGPSRAAPLRHRDRGRRRRRRRLARVQPWLSRACGLVALSPGCRPSEVDRDEHGVGLGAEPVTGEDLALGEDLAPLGAHESADEVQLGVQRSRRPVPHRQRPGHARRAGGQGLRGTEQLVGPGHCTVDATRRSPRRPSRRWHARARRRRCRAGRSAATTG
ncbi:MAG: ATP-dependent helicase [Acidimicrobiales bacterium]